MVLKKTVVTNTLMNMFLTASSFIFPLVTFPYISRTLGAAGNGKISFATSVVSYFVMFASLGIPTYGIRICAKCRDDRDELSKCVQELVFINLVTTVIAYVVFIVLLLSVPRFSCEKTLFLVLSTSIFFNALGIEWLYKAVEEYGYITIRSVVAKFIALVLMFFFIKTPEDYVIYGSLTIISSSGSYILNIVGAHKYINIKKYNNYDIKRHLKPIMVLFGASVAISIYGHMDTVMIGFMHGDVQNGLYGASTKIKAVLISVTSSLTTVLIPRMSYCIEQKDYKSISRYIEKGLRFVALLAFPMAFFCAINAEDCMIFLAGDEYAEAGYAFFFQSFCVIISSFSSVFSNQILVPYGEESRVFRCMCGGTVVNLILNALLIKPFGAAGASAATLITEILVCVLLFYSAKNVLNGILKITYIVQYLIVVIVSSVLSIMITRVIIINNLFFRLMLAGVSLFVCYFGILCFIREQIIVEIIEIMKNKFTNR